MLLLLLLACGPTCYPRNLDFYNTTTCPVCMDTSYSLVDSSYNVCRPDQEAHIEWEPALTGVRGEEEDRVGGVLMCTCKAPR